MSQNKEEVRSTYDTLIESEYYGIVSESDTKVFRIHRATKKTELCNKKTIEQFLGSAGSKRARWEIIPARYDYRPDKLKLCYFDSEFRMSVVNRYVPPLHLEQGFWNDEQPLSPPNRTFKSVEEFNNAPKCYVDYFTHLCNNDNDSLQYFIDWLSIAIRSDIRNITSLVLISSEGTGKGVLYDYVLLPLFGSDNTVQVKGHDALDTRFNNAFMNKQIVFLDEVEIKKTNAINRFKAFANPKLEIEQKGKDTILVKNWANTILTSNDLDAISVGIGNRRYSIIHTTDKRLDEMCAESDYKNVASLVECLENPENIRLLYNWLSTHQPSRNMNYAFESAAKASEIKEASLAEWELQTLNIFSEEFAKTNKTTHMYHFDLKERLLNSGVSRLPGSKIIKKLTQKFPNLVTQKWDNKTRKIFFEIKGVYEPAVEVEQGEYGVL